MCVCVCVCVCDVVSYFKFIYYYYIIIDAPFFGDPLIFSPVRINLSETLILGCITYGNPDPDVRIEDPDGVVLKVSSPTVFYTFENVTYDRAGNYRCIANNTIDSIKQIRVRPFEVIIQGKLLTLCIII